MKHLIKSNKVPENSLITENIKSIDYLDSFMIKKITGDSIGEIKTKMFALPKWVSVLLKIRHYLFVKPFGLSTGTHEIPVLYVNSKEIVIGENDKHLYFRISVLKKECGEASEIYLTTVVSFNNRWGKAYFFFIKPFHKLVCKSLLKKV